MACCYGEGGERSIAIWSHSNRFSNECGGHENTCFLLAKKGSLDSRVEFWFALLHALTTVLLCCVLMVE